LNIVAFDIIFTLFYIRTVGSRIYRWDLFKWFYNKTDLHHPIYD
jgi:hypothetical protein